MYSNLKSSTSINGFQSDYFANNLGLMQGEALSPILFSLYVNDFEITFLILAAFLMNANLLISFCLCTQMI